MSCQIVNPPLPTWRPYLGKSGKRLCARLEVLVVDPVAAGRLAACFERAKRGVYQ